MKKIYCLKVLLLKLFMLWGITHSHGQIPIDGLIAHYSFDKPTTGNRTTYQDESLNSNHGQGVGNLTYVGDRFGVGCSALHFDGSSYINVSNSPSLNSPDRQFSATVWVRIDQGANLIDEWFTIFCKSNIGIESNTSPHYRMHATAQTVSINTEFTEVFIPQLEYEQWYFYAYSYDSSFVKVYIDGQKVFQAPFSEQLARNQMPLEIGRDVPGKTEYFKGLMDDLRIYNRGLTSSEIQSIYRDASGQFVADRCNRLPISATPPGENSISSVPQQPPTTTAYPPKKTSKSLLQDLPNKIEDIEVDYQQKIVVKSTSITIIPYDGEKYDGDIISLNVNGEWILDKYELVARDAPLTPHLSIKLNPSDKNFLVSKAWSVGKVGRNTLTLEINDGETVQQIKIDSEIGLNGGIELVVAP